MATLLLSLLSWLWSIKICCERKLRDNVIHIEEKSPLSHLSIQLKYKLKAILKWKDTISPSYFICVAALWKEWLQNNTIASKELCDRPGCDTCPDTSGERAHAAPAPHIPASPECWDALCARQGRSVSWLRRGAGNHQSSASPVPWEGILGTRRDTSLSGAVHLQTTRVNTNG